MNHVLLCLTVLAGVACGGRRVPRMFGGYSYGPSPNYESFERSPRNLGAAAVCRLIPSSGHEVGGDILFQQSDSHSPVEVTGTVFGLTPGRHGFHIHQNGDVSDNCKGAGPHFNPAMSNHGAPEDDVRHAGDLGNIAADGNGVANFHIVDREISLAHNNPRQIVGRAVVVHAREDDLGRGRDAESLKTGNAGARVACCIIEQA